MSEGNDWAAARRLRDQMRENMTPRGRQLVRITEVEHDMMPEAVEDFVFTALVNIITDYREDLGSKVIRTFRVLDSDPEEGWIEFYVQLNGEQATSDAYRFRLIMEMF